MIVHHKQGLNIALQDAADFVNAMAVRDGERGLEDTLEPYAWEGGVGEGGSSV
jgi:hypothetical protein